MFRKTLPILILSWTSGCLDALGFLRLGRVFTANMTGNTVLFGLALAQGDWPALLRSLVALVGFSLGVVVGTLLVESKGERQQRTWAIQIMRSLIIEAWILLIFAVGWSWPGPVTPDSPTANLLIGLSALAMGQQSATIVSLGIPGVSTTYITGTITTLMSNISRHFSLRIHHQPIITPAVTAQTEHQKPARLASVWITYISAAIIGSYGELHVPLLAAFLPFLAVAIVVIMNLRLPPQMPVQPQ